MAFTIGYILTYIQICIACVTMVTANLERSTVTTKVGTYVGYVYHVDALGQKLASRRFLGIPYAEPPVGHLRFQKPKKKASLTEPLDAVNFPPVCPQQDIELGESRNEDAFKSVQFSEDCLNLNVYTPFEASDTKLPVMIFIHGGAFVLGTPNVYRADILSAYGNVIVVTIAYRLSIWGFLSTGDENLPGNYGLFDQQMAIKWVFDNIGAFGGDPELITLVGYSAGSASTVIQSMNPDNKGLIKRAIPMSGSMTCPWAFNFNPLNATRRLGHIVGCDAESTKELAECLRTIPTSEYQNVIKADEHTFHRYPFEFVPVVDGEFIPETPFQLINGNSETAQAYQNAIAEMDLMSGLVSNEGLMMITNVVGIKDTKGFVTNRQEFEEKLVPEITRVVFGQNAPDLMNKMIIGEYTNWDNPDDPSTVRESYMKLNSDYVFNIQSVEIARVHTKLSQKNTYMYLYDALPTQRLLPIPDWSTTSQHCDDQLTIFGIDNHDGFAIWTTPYPYPPAHPAHTELTKTHMTFLSNFIRSGNPNEPVHVQPLTNTIWPTYDSDRQQYLTLSYNMSNESVGSMLFAREYNYWRHVLPGVFDAVQGGQNRDFRQRDYCDKECDQNP